MIKLSFFKDISSKHLLHKSLALFWLGLLNKVVAFSLVFCYLSVCANPLNTDGSISYASEENKDKAVSSYNVDTVPNPRLENTAFHVSDPSSLLHKDTVTYLNEKLTALEKETGIESAVVILPSIGDEDVFELSQELFRKWGIGHKDKNDGLLITYLEDQHVIRFHTGYGLEGSLPDATGKRIQQRDMIPYFKKDNLDEGLKAGIDAVYKRLVSDSDTKDADTKESSTKANTDNADDDDDLVITLITIVVTVVLILIVAIGVMLYHKFEKCPQCGKRGTLKTIKKKTKHKHHRSYLKVTRRCSNCGYEVVNSYDLDDDDDSHYFSSGGFGGSSGGSSFGGGFSGGSSGGGGASSRW